MQQANIGTVSTTTYRYPQNRNPNSSDNQINQFPPSYASAPPFSTDYTTPDYTSYPSVYPPPNPNSLETVNSQSFTSHGFPLQTHPFQQQQSSIQEQSYGIPYDLNQQASTYSLAEPTFATPTANPNSFSHSAYSHLHPSKHHNSYDKNTNPDYPSGYIDDSSRVQIDGWRSRSGMGPELRVGGVEGYNSAPFHGDGYSDGAVYSYDGTKVDPHSARGVSSASPSFPVFDDYGRSITVPLRNESPVQAKIIRATPKVETLQDVGCGIQKFRVNLLPEGAVKTTMDVLCQVGLDGIRMLDPSSGLTLRIYPLDNITKCQVMDSSTFVFWSKSSVDVEPRRIRLQSNSYTTNTLLDTVTAATVQLKEMGGRGQRSESTETVEQSGTKKKSFADWMNRLKPTNEERDHWVPDEVVTKCTSCGTNFSAFVRRHHCRNCGDIFCDKCTHGRIALTAEENTVPVRVCDRCMAEATQRLSNAKDSVNKFTGLQSHGDLAKKLQEEMEKNQRASSGGGSKSDSSIGGRRMKEVVCPTCTVHLQVQAPSVGSETIECGVCQHPFLVSSQ